MSEDRRDFYRIDDEVALDYQLIDESEEALLVERIQAEFSDRFTASSDFEATSRQMAHVLHKAQIDSPDLARCIQMIDQKLNTLAQLLASEDMSLHGKPLHKVNISAGGLMFRTMEEVPVNRAIELRFVLFPTHSAVLTLSRVIHCERDDDSDALFPWQVAVEYEQLRESDRELLVRHIMSKQTTNLRAEREGAEE